MNKFFRSFLLCLFLMGIFTVSAYAAADTLKVGLRYGSGGMFSANLQNVTGSGWGYEVGYYDGNRNFVTLGSIDTNEISMTADGAVYIAADGTYSPSGSGAATRDLTLPPAASTARCRRCREAPCSGRSSPRPSPTI